MKKHLTKIISSAIALLIAIGAYIVQADILEVSATSNSIIQDTSNSIALQTHDIVEDGTYIQKDDVARYIHTYKKLPSNFVSKTKARNAGWNPEKGNLQDVLPGKSIGGSTFHDDDNMLPKKQGRTWKECDINYTGGHRGPERLVFSNDGLIFYTSDHYKSFEQLY